MVSTATLLCLSGCYAHAPHPGLVRVIDYADGAVIEVEIDDLRVDVDNADHVWIRAEVTQEETGCTPVAATFRDNEGAVYSFESVAFRSRAGSALGSLDGDEWNFSELELDRVLLVEPITFEATGVSTELHNELVFNLRQFVAQVECTTTAE